MNDILCEICGEKIEGFSGDLTKWGTGLPVYKGNGEHKNYHLTCLSELVALSKIMKSKWMHLETGKVYLKHTITKPLINVTNKNEGQWMVIYEDDQNIYVTEYDEFMDKFTPVIEED